MRPLEIVLILGELLTFLALVIPPFRVVRWMRYWALVVVALAAVEVLLEGPRWQLGPAYSLSAVFLLAAWLQSMKAERKAQTRRFLKRAVAGLGIVLGALALALAVALPILLPVFHFPQPTGPYGTGTVTYHWVDTSGPEMSLWGRSDRRDLMVQVWYPVEKGQKGRRAPYVVPGTSFVASLRLVHLPTFLLDHLKYVTTNSQPSAPMPDGQKRFPVLIFLPGRGGYRQNNTYQVEELVSHGYIVAGIDQPHTSVDVVFPSGRHVELDKRVADSVLDERIVQDAFMLEVFDYLGQDAVFSLDQLSVLNRADPERILTGRLDLQHVGIFGTSLGGIGAAEACRLDHRFRACLILDAAMPPDVVRPGLQQPTMWISADAETKHLEGWTPSAIREQETTIQPVFASLAGDGYLVFIHGMFHADISDLPNFVSPPLSRWLGTAGPTDWRRTHAIINAYSLAFFDRYLKIESAPLLNGPSRQFSEVHFEKRR